MPQGPSPEQVRAAIAEGRRHIRTQKEVADMLAEKILAKSLQRKWKAELAWVQIGRLRDQLMGLSGPDAALSEEIEVRRKLRRADARFAAAEIAHMTYEHEGLIKAIELNEAQIEKAEHPSPIVGAHSNLVVG
jgi:hypothetical protein